MGIPKKNSTVQSALLVIITLLMIAAGCTCPKSPKVHVNLIQGVGFKLTLDSVPEADHAIIYTFDADNHPLDTLDVNQGSTNDFFEYGDDVSKPIRCEIQYLKGQKLIVDDHIIVEETENNGNPIIATDVVMGFTTPPAQPQSCPQTTETASGYGEVIVPWTPGNWFEVRMTLTNNTVQKIGIQTEASTIPGNPGVFKVYLSDSHTCMDHPTCNGANIKAMMVNPASDVFTITGTDNNDQITPRQLKVTNSSGLLIKVFK